MTAHTIARRATHGVGRVLLALSLFAATSRAHSPHDVVNEMDIFSQPGRPVAIFASTQLTDHRLLARSLDGGETWSLHALPVSERGVTSIDVSPTFSSDGTIFVATVDAGLVKSVDRGESWTALEGSGLPDFLLCVAMLGDYSVSKDVVCSTPFGVYTSGDGGLSWSLGGAGLPESKLGVLACAREAGNVEVVLGGGKSFVRSDDRGATWTSLHTFEQRIRSLAVSPNWQSDQTALVSLESGGGVFVTTDGGSTWDAMTSGLVETSVPEVGLSDDGRLYLVTPVDGLHVADAPLGRWSKVVAPGFEPLSELTTEHYRTLRVGASSNEPGLVVGAFEGLYVAVDGGQSFRQGDIYSQRFNRRVVFSPDYDGAGAIYAVNYGGGLYRTPVLTSDLAWGQGGGPGVPGSGSQTGEHVGQAVSGKKDAPSVTSWTPLARGIEALFGQSLVLSPDFLVDDTMFYAQRDMYRSNDRGLTWTELPLPPGVQVIRAVALSPGFATDRTLIAGAGLTGGIFRSQDAGDSFVDASVGLPTLAIPSAIRYSPTYPVDDLVFMSLKEVGLWRSSDGGDSWTPANDGLGSLDLRALEVSPDFANDHTLYVGTSEAGLWRSVDAAASWQPVNTGMSPGLPLQIESIALSPDFANDDTLYVANLVDGIWRSTDRGESWTPVGAGLPPDPPRVVSLSPAFPDDPTVVVSTFDWLYRSTDAGASWKRMKGYNRIDDLDFNIVEVGDWIDLAATDAHGKTTSEASDAGASLSFFVSASSLRWFSRRGPDMGQVRISVDGGSFVELDLYAADEGHVAPVFSRDFDEVGFHALRIVVKGTSNPLSLGTRVVTDGFEVTF